MKYARLEIYIFMNTFAVGINNEALHPSVQGKNFVIDAKLAEKFLILRTNGVDNFSQVDEVNCVNGPRRRGGGREFSM